MGDAEEDLRDLEEAERLARGIVDPEWRTEYETRLRELLEIVQSYVDCYSSGAEEPFADWVYQHGRRYK